MKTSELTGAALDWAVCKTAGLVDAYPSHKKGAFFLKAWKAKVDGPLRPSTDWAQGGPIIEREKISVFPMNTTQEGWCAHWHEPTQSGAVGKLKERSYGPTPLVAAMRCFVASKLGAEVDVPEELR